MSVKLKHLRVILRKKKPLLTLLPVLAALVLAGLFIHVLNMRMRPVLEAKASSQAANLITQAISTAVDDCLQENHVNYGDFVTVTTDSAGKITSLTSNTVANNRFKRQVVEAVSRQLNTLDSDALKIPLGTLTGQPLLSGAGPSVQVRVDSVADISADYVNSFASAGVNQTMHRVCLEIKVTIHLFLAGGILPVSTASNICVAETIIVGETPDTYLNLEKRNG